MISEKFMPPFISFIDKHFGRDQHKYVYITSEKYLFGLKPEHGVEFLHTDKDIYETLLGYMIKARKIILHGLWINKVNQLLVQNPTLFNKCFWIMWGGDFYHRNKYNSLHIDVIRNVKYLITFMAEDVAWIKREYQSVGNHLECFAYPSNIFTQKLELKNRCDKQTNLMVGHSGIEENLHIDVFNVIKESFSDNVSVFCPLSYPAKNSYIEHVVSTGTKLFGDSFIPLLSWMHLEEYNAFLDSIDIAVLPSWRQHAMGNIIGLVGRGINVYIDDRTTTWEFLNRINVEVSSYRHLALSENKVNITKNYNIISCLFSEERLKNDWKKIFNI